MAIEHQELVALVLHGREERNLEYKRCVSWNSADIKAKIAKTVLAMSNIRDGGAIVVGVEQQGEKFDPTGLQEEEWETFTQDGVSSHLNEFADPFAEVTVSKITLTLQKPRVLQTQGVKGEAVVVYADPLRTQQMLYRRLSRRVNNMAVLLVFWISLAVHSKKILKKTATKGYYCFFEHFAMLFMQL
jgi:hypothetical protein